MIDVTFEVELLLCLGIIEILPFAILHLRRAVHVSIEDSSANGYFTEGTEDLSAAKITEHQIIILIQ